MPGVMEDAMYMALPWLLLTAGLILVTCIDPYLSRSSRKRILSINVLLILILAAHFTEYVISVTETNDLPRTLCSAFVYAVHPVLLVLFMETVFASKSSWPLWIPAGLNAAVSFVSIFTGIAFVIKDNHFYRGPLNRLNIVVNILLIVILTVRLIQTSLHSRGRNMTLILFASGLILAGMVSDSVIFLHLYPVSFVTMGIIASIVFYYIWLHMQLSREHEETALRNLQAKHRVELMVSQIQPHFLYNTLSTIQALCRTDPEKAFDLTEQFGCYLRQNLSSMNQTDLIPFEKEIENTRIYAQIEQVRFPSIRIMYDLQDADFHVPALTVQPLVENAIRHGVRSRKQGEIHILSHREYDAHVIVIRDNGEGFDVEAALRADGDHIGLRNVRERVEQMCAGSVEIFSRIGEGTAITLRFPIGKETK